MSTLTLEEEMTAKMLRDKGTWVFPTHLCVKQGSPLGGEGRCGIVLPKVVGEPWLVRNHTIGGELYGGPFEERFETIDDLLNAGWVVD